MNRFVNNSHKNRSNATSDRLRGDKTVKSPFRIWLTVWEHMPQTGGATNITSALSACDHTDESSPDALLQVLDGASGGELVPYFWMPEQSNGT